jgi:hypothetical protein
LPLGTGCVVFGTHRPGLAPNKIMSPPTPPLAPLPPWPPVPP